MKAYSSVTEIRKVIPKLKTCRTPGKTSDGQRIQIRYEAFGKVTDKAKRDAIPAKKAGLDLRIYTGILDRVWTTPAPNSLTCFTMLVLERLDSVKREYGYRTFNIGSPKRSQARRGRIRWLKVL